MTNAYKVLCALNGSCKTLGELCEELNLNNRQVSNAAGKLVLRGYAERIERGCFQLTSGGEKALQTGERMTSGPNGPNKKIKEPKLKSLRQRAWNAMQFAQVFTAAEIQMVAARPGDKKPENSIQKFCKQLCKAGYLQVYRKRVQGSRVTSNGFLKYRLVNSTGELAPSYRGSSRSLFDHNTGEEIKL